MKNAAFDPPARLLKDYLKITKYGFKWGPLEVVRLCSDKKFGVLVELRTENGRRVTVRATPSGRKLIVEQSD